MLYQVSQGTKYFGADTVFEDVQFEIKNNEKITIVGRNGCGKTTFLRCMSNELSFDKGSIFKPADVTIGYLAQKVLENDEATVEEELMSVFTDVFNLQKQMHDMEEEMKTSSDEKLLNRYAQAQERFEQMNGYNWETEMHTVFTRFGFGLEDLKRKIGTFSGGQKTRIAFSKLLL